MTFPGPDLIKECPRCKAPFRHGTLASFSCSGNEIWTDGRDFVSHLMESHLVGLRCGKCPACRQVIWFEDARDLGKDEYYGRSDWINAYYYLYPRERDYLEAIEADPSLAPDRLRYLRTRAWWAANNVFRKLAEAKEHPPLTEAETEERNKRRQETLVERNKRRQEPLRLDDLRFYAWLDQMEAEQRFPDGVAANGQPTHSEPARQNMKCLFDTLDESNERDRVTRAELARELGWFDEAERLIDFPFNDDADDADFFGVSNAPDRHLVKLIENLTKARQSQVAKVRGDEALTPEEIHEIAERQRLREEERLSRQIKAPPWDRHKPRLEQFFEFVCRKCSYREQVGLWYNAKTCAQCKTVTVITHDSEY